MWPRISVGGILILDHFSFESTPQEKIIVRKHIKNHKVQQLPFSGPAAYIQKNEKHDFKSQLLDCTFTDESMKIILVSLKRILLIFARH